MKTQIGDFIMNPIKTRTRQPLYEVSYGMNYLGLIMQHPDTKKWAVTHNMWHDPSGWSAGDHYRHETPNDALQFHNRQSSPDLKIEFDATCLNILPMTPRTLFMEDAQKVADRTKLEAVINDPSKSEGARQAARKQLEAIV